ncbi:MAG: amidohydrolase family protein [Spirochaetales bacterium]|nr:amidohydrolase family protein [Spirochaetales bacterium]MCF7937290.1 amidohydrolase family protein [Spirochaetales bacterium]
MQKHYSFQGVTLVTPDSVLENSSIGIEGKRIGSVGNADKHFVDYSGTLYVYPGLINIHDHLRGDYLPRVGPKNRAYYVNWSYWDNDLKGSDVVAERSNISVDQMYYLSAYKNLFSGVTTVNDHFPHEFNEPFIPHLPIRVISDYTLAHECSSYDLGWGDGVEIEHRRAVKRNHPFITHLEEGFDQESQQGIDYLESLNILDDHCVFIHCLGFSEEDIRKTSEAGAHVSWCPGSNIFMFNVTCKIREMLEAGINVSIGTDSTATGSVNLLEEVRFARRIYREMYQEDIPAETLVHMITRNPAKAFRMDDRIGRIEPGMFADLLFLRPRRADPYEALVEARMEDIALLTLEGKPIYGEADFHPIFEQREVDGEMLNVADRRMLVAGEPAGLLRTVRKAVGFEKHLDYLPFSMTEDES